MTLDEAIMHCEEVADRCSVTDGNRTCESDHRQLAEWLKELKKYRQENDWTPCGKKKPKDSISRKDAIDALSTPHGILYPIRTIEDLPSAQPERKKGKWVDLKCNQCGQVDMSKPNFCPNCGSFNGEVENVNE